MVMQNKTIKPVLLTIGLLASMLSHSMSIKVWQVSKSNELPKNLKYRTTIDKIDLDSKSLSLRSKVCCDAEGKNTKVVHSKSDERLEKLVLLATPHKGVMVESTDHRFLDAVSRIIRNNIRDLKEKGSKHHKQLEQTQADYKLVNDFKDATDSPKVAVISQTRTVIIFSGDSAIVVALDKEAYENVEGWLSVDFDQSSVSKHPIIP
jgi:hypothetical protein